MADKKKSVSIMGGRAVPIDSSEKKMQALFSIEQYASYEVLSGRSATSKVTLDKKVEPDDVLEVNIEGDITLFVRRDDYENDYQTSSRSSSEDQLVIDHISAGRPSRGISDWVVRALNFFRVPIADKAGREICEKFEDNTIKKPGLNKLRIRGSGDQAEVKLDPAKIAKASEKPILIFIHGTASNTEGSFGELFKNNSLSFQLKEFYGSEIYALEHHTLTKSPIENAIDLANSLPKNSLIHLVSHSRGGLVAELLCRGTKVKGQPINSEELSFYENRKADILDELDDDIREDVERAYEAQIADLKKLSDILADRKFTINRFVRVACPARGTTLASGRLDRWLSVIFNLVGFIPALRATPYYSLLKNFIIALVKTRTKPQVLPGLEAQMPGSPLISLLNANLNDLSADLTVISGDIEKQGILGKIALFFTDQFYEDNHDLVVNTSSMFGGGERENTPRYYFDKGTSVSHFNYFRNNKTSNRVLHGLTGSPELLATSFTEKLPELERPIARSIAVRTGPRPIVYVLPGILGSELSIKDNPIWADKWELIRGGLGKLNIDKEHVNPSNVIESAYARLIEFLSADHEVIPFYYDWRLPLSAEAKRLSESVNRSIVRNQEHGLPVSIIAHSMGGLVVRMMIASHRDVWDSMIAHEQSRFIMLGTPNKGSYSIPRVLVGQEKLVKLLALIDLKNSKKEILEIISQYPGILNMLPRSDSGMDLYSQSTWQQIAGTGKGKYPVPDANQLNQAKDIRALLDTVVYSDEKPGKVLYVAGKDKETPVNISIDNNRVKFQATADGDGRVPWNTGIPKNIPAWYVNVVHGDLANHSPSFAAYRELLLKGTTTRLSKDRPARSRGVPEIFDLPPDEVQYQPNQADITRAALGASSSLFSDSDGTSKIGVKVTHGDLIFARYPVAVGHYFNHGIYSAEAALDDRLGNKLSMRNKLGLYPGKLNTCEVIFDPNSKPYGAVIIGLGDVGDLSVTSLTNAYTQAMKEYALYRHEFNKTKSADVHDASSKNIGISTVIIGSGNGGMALIDCIQAMLEGVLNTNHALRNLLKEDSIAIDKIEIIELWEDVAIHATKQMQRLLKMNKALEQGFDFDNLLHEGEGSRYRSLYSEEDSWWQRMQIRETDDHHLSFKTISNLARNEYRIFPTDKSKIDMFIEKATASTSTNNNLPKSLFEMLVPNELKKVASTSGDTVLLLNEGSARYPWELLQDRWGDADGPPATNFKILRQLESEFFTEHAVLSTEDNALVVGAPKLGDKWSDLPGAVDEARLVANLLSANQINTISLIEPDGFQVLDSLYSESYKILHLAGHGVYNFKLDTGSLNCDECGSEITIDNIQSGMVISDNMLLTPADIEKMRFAPELVFINCCHLGEIERRREHSQFPSIAANLATQFIRKGSRAVVAAGWEVDDRAALVFANVFYASMLEGENYGTAVLRARKETYARHGSVNTWGAYQCYGDPEYKINVQNDNVGHTKDWPFVSANELVMTLTSMSNEVKTKTKEEDFLGLTNKLEQIVEGINENAGHWLGHGNVCASLGDVYKELAEFDQAIKWYKKSLTTEDAKVYVHAAEQLGNIVIRQSVIKAFSSGASNAEIRACDKRIKLATEQLHALTNMFPDKDDDAKAVTVERLNILGSAYKRQALMAKLFVQREMDNASLKQVRDALDEMEHYYLSAAWITPTSVKSFNKRKTRRVDIENLWGGKELPSSYAYLNYMTARVLNQQLIRGNAKSKDTYISKRDKYYLNRLEEIAIDSDKKEPSFWNMVSVADIKLLKALVEDNLKDSSSEILDLYKKAIKRAASKRQIGTVIENITAIAELYDPVAITITGRDKERRENYDVLKKLVAEIEA